MKFRVNKGFELGCQPPDNGDWVLLKEGDEVEGPPNWVNDFAWQMSPLTAEGKAIDPKALQAMPEQLKLAAGAQPHERVGMLKDMLAKSESMTESLRPELERAEREADDAAKEAATRRGRAESGGVPVRDTGGPVPVQPGTPPPTAPPPPPEQPK